MEWFVIDALIVIVKSLARELRGVWADVRAGRRSLATSLAFTIILVEMASFFVVLPLVRPAGAAKEVVESSLVGLGLAAGILGAIGLVADRRRRRRAGADAAGGDAAAEED